MKIERIFITLIITLLTTTSCKIDESCGDYKIFNSDIYISGWRKDDFTIKKAVLIEKNNTNSTSKKYIINKIINSFQFKEDEDDEVLLRITSKFKTNKSYRLILNDTLEYRITKFVTQNIERGTAVTTKIYCELKSYQINGKNIEHVGNHLRFHKNLGISLK